MDSSNLRSINSGSATNDIADNSSMMVPSKRDIFLSTYNPRQRFTLPDSMMHYIAKNPKNAKVYQKMVKCSKYFFIKNPILVIGDLSNYLNEWTISVNGTRKNIDINRISTKLWITDRLSVFRQHVSNNSLASSVIPKIYQCDYNYLSLSDQVISLNEFMFLCSSVEDLNLHRVTVKNDDGTVVLFDKLFEHLSQLRRIEFTFTTPSNNISKTTFKELWKIPHLSNYDRFDLENIPEDFDIDSFYSFMKKNKNARIALEFCDEISEEYKIRLEAIVDEIIATKDHEYKPPFIGFPGIDREKFFKLCRLHLQ